MFSFIGGRISQRGQPVLLYFAFISGEVKSTNKSSSCSTISQRQRFKITTAVSGFAKPKTLCTGMEILAWFLVGGKYIHDFCIPLDFLGIKDPKKNKKRPKIFSKATDKATATLIEIL